MAKCCVCNIRAASGLIPRSLISLEEFYDRSLKIHREKVCEWCALKYMHSKGVLPEWFCGDRLSVDHPREEFLYRDQMFNNKCSMLAFVKQNGLARLSFLLVTEEQSEMDAYDEQYYLYWLEHMYTFNHHGRKY